MDVEDTEGCYRAVKSRDRRFDGIFYTAVRTTGIYCRPSCPAITPHKRNVVFYRTAAAAQAAGFRACRRCRPDATPGSPDWDVAADTTGRAMRLVADGVVDRDGVEGLARRLGYTARHLSRILVAQAGASPLALARARRAHTARILVETTTMSFADAAFASGFGSVRQFNDTVRAVYASSPSQLRARSRPESPHGGARKTSAEPAADGRVELRLAVRRPFASAELLGFLAARAVPGVEEAGPGWFRRTLRLPHGHGLVTLAPDTTARGGTGQVRCSLSVSDLRDVATAVERSRRLLDLDADPVAVDEELGRDAVMAPLVRCRPGLRVPGHVDGNELAVRAVLGQQVSVRGARTLAARLTMAHGETVAAQGALTHLFPSPQTLAQVDPRSLPMPRPRARALVTLCRALADGEVVLDRSADRREVRAALTALPGIGPWTADYVALRALGDPDAFLPSDVGVRHALAGLGADPAAATGLAGTWRPWRAYAVMHLWATLGSS